MRRRTLFRAALTVAAWLKVPGARAWAQEVTFPGARRETLDELAATVLPSALGRAGVKEVTDAFVDWVRDYRSGLASWARRPVLNWIVDRRCFRRKAREDELVVVILLRAVHAIRDLIVDVHLINLCCWLVELR